METNKTPEQLLDQKDFGYRFKLLALILLISLNFKSQTNFKEFYFKNDLAFDYYRGAIISGGSSLILNKIIKKPFLSGLIGFTLGYAQGLIFERGLNGKIVSCMGTTGGTFVYIIHLNLKNKQEQEILKYKQLNN